MKKPLRFMVIPLFLWVVLLMLIVISCYPSSSVRAANSTFGFYFGSPTTKAKVASTATKTNMPASTATKTNMPASTATKTNMPASTATKTNMRASTATKTNMPASPTLTTDRSGVPLVIYGYLGGVDIGMQRNPLTIAHAAIDYYNKYKQNGNKLLESLSLNNSNWLVSHAI